MNRLTQHLLMLLLGVVTVRVAAGDAYLAFVQPGFRWFLLAGGVAVALVATAGIWAERPGAATDGHPPEPDDGHGHGHTPRVAWLLVLPVAVLLVVGPGPLGSYTAAQQSGPVRAEDVAVAGADPAPAAGVGIGADDEGQDYRTMPLTGYIIRTLQADTSALEGRQVRLVGFVTPREGGGWYVSRILINCCAADARAVGVVVDQPIGDLRPDQWVEVIGRYVPSMPHPSSGYPEPSIEPVLVTPIETPVDPYSGS